jgi:addiction module HigA family antidote
MIISFGSKDTEKVWNGERVSKWPLEIQEIGSRKLRMINNAQNLSNLKIPPSNNMEKLRNIHPGEILREEFLIPMQISAYKLAKDINIPQTRISEIIKGRRRISADTALRLSKYFGTTAKFWLGLQNDFDLEEEQSVLLEELSNIHQLSSI